MMGWLVEMRRNPMMWLLVFVPVVLVAEHLKPESHTLLFFLAVVAIVPLAALLSRSTESVAARTGDLVGGLLNATLGNLTEMVIAFTALRQGMLDLVKASIAGAVVTNTLFMLGLSFFLGGLRHHRQEFNRETARLQGALLFLATIAIIIPSAISRIESPLVPKMMTDLSFWLSFLLLGCYALSLVFSLGTHRERFASQAGEGGHEEVWPLAVAGPLLGVVTVLIALVSEVFVGSVQQAAAGLGMSQAFVGFVVVSLVGAAAEMAAAVSAARKNRPDLTVGIALGSSTQIALFVAPVLILVSYVVSPAPMDLGFLGAHVFMVLMATLTALIVTNGGDSTWYSGVLLMAVYSVFAVALYLAPA